MKEQISRRFEELTKHAPAFVVRAPGRVNIIGEHTDYNDGLVLPGAIDKALWFAVRPTGNKTLRFWALDIAEEAEVPIEPLEKSGHLWLDYLLGIAEQFVLRGHHLIGLDVVFGGNLPVGAGVSSSAALEAGMAVTWNHLLNAGLTPPELAQLAQQSSHRFVGIPCGIMDQFASLNGAEDQVILLDCSDLSYTMHSAAIEGCTWLLLNSKVSHNLAESAYPQRVKECKAAVDILQKQEPSIQSLRLATPDMVDAARAEMSEEVYKRAKYVTEEHLRTLAMLEALKVGDADQVGALLNGTHAGLRDKYEVSCPEIETLKKVADELPGVYGARIMGGGFGGCTLNLVANEAKEQLVEVALDALRKKHNIDGDALEVHLSAGAGKV